MKQEVAESSFDFLHFSLVDTFSRSVCLSSSVRPFCDPVMSHPSRPMRHIVMRLLDCACICACVCVRARALAHPGRWRERVNACLHARTRVLNGGRACMFVLTSSVSTLCLCTCPFTHARRSATRTHREKDLDTVGFQVGQKLAERYSKDKGVFENDLAVITFLCKDFWTEVYGKQMDKLRTNHKGVFELQDHRFRSVLRISTVHNTRGRTLVPPDRYAGHARHVTPVYALLPTHPHQAAGRAALYLRSPPSPGVPGAPQRPSTELWALTAQAHNSGDGTASRKWPPRTQNQAHKLQPCITPL